jgi:hypothetical protein
MVSFWKNKNKKASRLPIKLQAEPPENTIKEGLADIGQDN